MEKIALLAILLSLTTVMHLDAQSSIHPQQLRCEYLDNPEGIDETAPRLSWTLAATHPESFGQRQTAYHILVSSTPDGKGDQWDSQWVPSNAMQQIVYKGNPLHSDQRYFWKVQVKDEAGRISPWSDPAQWSMGLLNRLDWTAQFIGAGDSYDPTQKDCNIADPWLRKSFTISFQPKRATFFVASVGYHEVYVNGEKLGDAVLSPCVSDHSRRARYIAYDIAAKLHPGRNTIAIWLGTSWSIFSSFATDDKPRAPIVIAQADLYAGETPGDKPLLRILTDTSWQTHPSPSRLLGSWSFGHMGGECWDGAKDTTGWSGNGVNDSAWRPAKPYVPRLTLSAQMVEPNRLFQEIHPIAIETRPDGSFRVDMGVNFAGFTQIKLKGNPGQRIDLRFSEREQDEMTFNNYSAYIPGPTGEGVFHNRFNYSSGRWITIRGATQKPALSDIRGWVVHTAYAPIATFECSDSLQNWIYNHTLWNYENLSIGGYVVDCPQRERLGYGGDANATSETGMDNFRLGAFYTKWLEDWRDVQGNRQMDPLNYGGNADDGILPHTAPTYQGGGGPSWGGITVVLPWYVYQREGDTRILEKNFDMMVRWLAFLDSHVRNHLLDHFGGVWDFLGDWLWPHAGAEGMNNGKPQNLCYNNCYRVYDLRTATKIARVLGRTKEAVQWETEADAAARAIHAKYYNPGDHSYSDSSMGNLAIALLAQIPPPSLRDSVMQRLEKEILLIRQGHIHVGITGGAFLFRLLREAGRDDLLYSMTSRTDYPSWGYMKASGATTIWEMWEKDLPGHSLLHSSYLYPGSWYIEGVGGIRYDPQHPGYQHFIVRPPKLSESQLRWASATLESPAGRITTSWQRHNGALHLEVTVPPNTSATIYLPGRRATVVAGHYTWSVKE